MDALTTANSDSKRMSRLLVVWLSLGLATGFLLWITLSGLGELEQVAVGLRRYLFFLLPVGMAAAGVICTLLWFTDYWVFVIRLSAVSCVFYLGFLKVLGWVFIPWVLIAVAAIGLFRIRKLAIETRSSLLLLHSMGSLSGLYMTFNLNKFLQPMELFMETVQSLWLLVVG